MTKIGTKLLLGFGIFICILIVHTILGQLTKIKATETHNILTKKISPAVKLCNDIKMNNKDLFLLVSNKVADSKNDATSNRINKIIEDELPYHISHLKLLKQNLQPADTRNRNIDAIADYSSKSIVLIEKINTLLLTSKDYKDEIKLNKATDILNNSLSQLLTEVDNRVSLLQIKYNKELEDNFYELSSALLRNSRVFLLTSLIFICFGLFITYRNINAIVKPINTLLDSVKRIQEGNYDHRVSIKGIDEFSLLGTAFNQMSESLKTSFDQINAKNKELEQFVYIASHDLQEPLRTVNSFTNLLEKDYKDNLDQNAAIYIQFISQASTRMSLLVKGLLDYSRIGGNKELTLIDCNELIDSLAVDLAALISAENAQLEVGELPKIYAYKTDIRLLFQNLINNAIKFHRPHVTPVIKIKAEELDDFWKFSICDNGIGIEEDNLKKIFAMFQRLHSTKKYAGTGIGLAHCSKIIEMHKGTFTVDSEIGNGSTFYITISKHLMESKNAALVVNT